MNSYYTMITPYLAIGELNAGKLPHNFDAVINLAYINPSFNNGLNHREHSKSYYHHENNKKITYSYSIGLYDSDHDADYFEELLHLFIPLLLSIFSNKNTFSLSIWKIQKRQHVRC